ncbi:MAG: hypothetical protein KDJ47_04800 [Hyphomicrobiaceae bacterium]|nr:hypothetical protein [Hyphomicrobiaceae bacterium]
MSKSRAYIVEGDGDQPRIVNGISAAQVLRYVTRGRIEIRVAKNSDFVEAMESGIKPEYADREMVGKDEEESE